MSTSLRLETHKACILLVDVQEKLSAIMPKERMEFVTQQIQIMLQSATILGLPVLYAEQYPKGMGTTLPELKQFIPEGVTPTEKLKFSCCGVGSFDEDLKATLCRQVIVCGMETHICVFQTVRDLCEAGYEVFVNQDAVISRRASNEEVGLRLMERAGAVITSTESYLFDLMGQAGGKEFKAVQRLIK